MLLRCSCFWTEICNSKFWQNRLAPLRTTSTQPTGKSGNLTVFFFFFFQEASVNPSSVWPNISQIILLVLLLLAACFVHTNRWECGRKEDPRVGEVRGACAPHTGTEINQTWHGRNLLNGEVDPPLKATRADFHVEVKTSQQCIASSFRGTLLFNAGDKRCWIQSIKDWKDTRFISGFPPYSHPEEQHSRHLHWSWGDFFSFFCSNPD